MSADACEACPEFICGSSAQSDVQRMHYRPRAGAWEPSNETSLLSSSIRRFVWLGKCQMAVTKCEIDWRPAKPKPNGCVCVCVWRKKLAIPCGTVTEKGQQKQHKRQDKYLKFIGSISMTAFNGYYIRAMAYRFEGPHTAVSERSQSITKVKTRMTSG